MKYLRLRFQNAWLLAERWAAVGGVRQEAKRYEN